MPRPLNCEDIDRPGERSKLYESVPGRDPFALERQIQVKCSRPGTAAYRRDMINQTLMLRRRLRERHESRMSFAVSSVTRISGAFAMFRIPAFDLVSVAVMGFGIVLAAALPFVF